jgi:thiamine-monophosphate kinase
MDLSDGLSSSLYQLGSLNEVGFIIDQDHMPYSPFLWEIMATDPSFPAVDTALHFGGDYELLLTCSPDDFPLLQGTLSSISLQLTAIGHVTKSEKIILKSKKTQNTLPNKGYEHFKEHSMNM